MVGMSFIGVSDFFSAGGAAVLSDQSDGSDLSEVGRVGLFRKIQEAASWIMLFRGSLLVIIV